MKIFLSGGGTGGHVYPILAVVRALILLSAARRSLDPRRPEGEPAEKPPIASESRPAAPADAGTHEPEKKSTPSTTTGGREEVTGRSPVAHDPRQRTDQPGIDRVGLGGKEALELTYIGEAGGIEEGLARTAGIPFESLTSGQIRGRSPLGVARSIGRMLRGMRQCSALIRAQRPAAVFITGGYVTAPLALAAWRAHVPILIYLPDLTPGLAIKWLSRLARRVAVSFPEVIPYFGQKAVVTGYPVRSELLNADRAAARMALGLDAGPGALPVVLVFGGSRGARSINQATTEALPRLLAECQLIHVSGQLDWSEVSAAADQLPARLRARYHAYPYLHKEMLQALVAADIAVARAGASTLGEFPAVSLPSVLVPYPYAGQHQHANADYLVNHGAAVIVEDGDLSARLASVVLELLHATEKRKQMARAAYSLARPDAAANIARLIFEMAGR